MDKRFFAGRQIKASIHDGTRYKKSHGDSEEDGTQRETWSDFIGAGQTQDAHPSRQVT